MPAGLDTLAALLSPASRVEPELLRAVRLECLPELPVDAELELWFGPFVDARSDGGITFAPEELRELRERLRVLYEGEGRALVERARVVMGEVHAGISPLLRVEEELAWSAVAGDDARAAAIADEVVRVLAAGRDGAEHWVARSRPTLSDATRTSRSGWVLGQVAGAKDLPAPPQNLAGYELAALASTVPTARLLLRRRGGVLTLGAPQEEAEASIDLPDTWPRGIEVTVGDDRPRRTRIDEGTAAEMPVGEETVRLRTLTGDVYALADPRRELLDSVLLGPGGAWCVTRVTDAAAVLMASDLGGALAAVGPVRPPVDLARSLGRTAPEEAGQLFALTFNDARASAGPWGPGSGGSTPTDGVAALPVRERGRVEADTVVRTLARGLDGVESVTLRATEPFGSVLVALDASGLDLVPGAPVVDDGDLLFGVVAPRSWSSRPAAVRSDLLAWALEAAGAGAPRVVPGVAGGRPRRGRPHAGTDGSPHERRAAGVGAGRRHRLGVPPTSRAGPPRSLAGSPRSPSPGRSSAAL